MEEKKEINLSFLVIACFILLFFIFLAVKPSTSGHTVASSIVGGMGISEDFSVITLILAFVTLIVFLALILFIYKKVIKHPKRELPKAPTPKRELPDLDKGRELFYDDNKPLGQEEEPIKEEIPKVETRPLQTEQKVLTNLNLLKRDIVELLKQNYNKENIISVLKSKGWSIEQIVKSIDEINMDNLRNYIKKAFELGFNKEQVVMHLKRSGWDDGIISKILPK